MAAAIGFPVSAAIDIFYYKQNPYGRRSEPPGSFAQNNRVNFNLYVVSLWVNGAIGRVLGRLKRRPYNFSFYVVPL